MEESVPDMEHVAFGYHTQQKVSFRTTEDGLLFLAFRTDFFSRNDNLFTLPDECL